MQYTPRVLFAWYRAEVDRRSRELAHTAIALRSAQHADGKQFDKLIEQLTR